MNVRWELRQFVLYARPRQKANRSALRRCKLQRSPNVAANAILGGFRSFLADERGLTNAERVLIAALVCAGTIVLLEALGHSLSQMLISFGHNSRM